MSLGQSKTIVSPSKRTVLSKNRHIFAKKRHFFQNMFFFTFLLGSMGREAPRSSRRVPGASLACPNTPRTGVFRQASDSVKTDSEMDLR